MYVSRGAEPRNKLYYCDLHLLPDRKIQGKIIVKINNIEVGTCMMFIVMECKE